MEIPKLYPFERKLLKSGKKYSLYAQCYPNGEITFEVAKPCFKGIGAGRYGTMLSYEFSDIDRAIEKYCEENGEQQFFLF